MIMLSSGVPKLDELLGGGVEEGRVVLIEAVSCVGDLLALNFVVEALKRGMDSFMISGRKSAEDVRRFLMARGADVSKLKTITTSDRNSKLNLDELFLISHTIKELAKSMNFGLIDILHPLLILHDPRKVYSLLSDIVHILRDSKVTTVMGIDKRFVDNRTLAMLEDLSDVVIELEEVVEGLSIRRGIRIKKNVLSPPTDFYSLKLDGTSFSICERI